MSGTALVVLLYGRRIATIERDDSWLTLRYEDDYSGDPGATPLSLSMPPTTTRHRTRATEAYLRGLLPDNGAVTRRWAARAGIKESDTLGLIRQAGRDTPGAAMFIAPAEVPEVLAASGHVEPVTEKQIGERLRRLRADEADWRPASEHWSLAGAQGKFTLARTATGWGIAHGAAPSTHIIKPGIAWLPAQALTEHVSQEALRRAGLDAAASAYAEFDGEPAIVIERFDRAVDARGGIARIHQEDMCQALGILPHKKYPSDGGPGVQQIGELLTRRAQEGDTARFADGVIGNYLIGAPDAHAKNYSVLLAGPEARFAPLYDVASGLCLRHRNGRLRFPKAAMSVGGENRFGVVAARHWEKFARQLDLDPGAVRDRVRELSEAIPDAISDAIATLPSSARNEAAIAALPSHVASLAGETRRLLDSPT